MEYLHNGYTLELSPDAFPLSTDSIALAHFVKLPKNARVLDLGSGCGTLGLYLCALDEGCTVCGLELTESTHKMALHNASANNIPHRLNSVCGDIRNIPEIFPSGSFSCCISNPPYFSSGPQSQKTPLARREDCCSLSELFAAAGWALQYGGDFFIVHRPERLAELCACGAQYKLEAKKLLLLRHRSDGPVSLILMQFRKGGKPGLIWQEESLSTADGTKTDYYRSLYHI